MFVRINSSHALDRTVSAIGEVVCIVLDTYGATEKGTETVYTISLEHTSYKRTCVMLS